MRKLEVKKLYGHGTSAEGRVKKRDAIPVAVDQIIEYIYQPGPGVPTQFYAAVGIIIYPAIPDGVVRRRIQINTTPIKTKTAAIVINFAAVQGQRIAAINAIHREMVDFTII
jgi:hypothetical protein